MPAPTSNIYPTSQPYRPKDLIADIQTNGGPLAMVRSVIPAASLPATTRYVHTVTFTAIGNPTALIIHALQVAGTPGGFLGLGASLVNDPTISLAGPGTLGNSITQISCCTAYVTTDHTAARRFGYPTNVSGGNNEVYGASVSLPFGRTYAEIGVGVLFGFYGTTGAPFLLGKKIHIESLWLTQSGANTVLNMALYNNDAGAPAADQPVIFSAFTP